MEAIGGGREVAEVTMMTPVCSPRNKVKFLCSHGGKILPRASDGQLKYFGGETRVVSIVRDITFLELMKKLNTFSNGEMVLKYQVIPEDLEILVSVTCDNDLYHMFDEYDLWETKSSQNGNPSRFRAFLFPSTPIFINTQVFPDRFDIEKRYIEAINGNYSCNLKNNMSRSIFGISSSNESSPRSIHHENYPFDTNNQHEGNFISTNYQKIQNNVNKEIERVNSSSSLYNLGNLNHHYQCHPSNETPFYHSSRQQNLYKRRCQRLVTTLSVGQTDIGRFQMDQSPLSSS